MSITYQDFGCWRIAKFHPSQSAGVKTMDNADRIEKLQNRILKEQDDCARAVDNLNDRILKEQERCAERVQRLEDRIADLQA